MGKIRELITGADESDKIVQEQNAHLDTLAELADVKAELFTETIAQKLINAGQGTDKTIPITQVQDSITETHAYLSSNADKISGAVTDAVQGFVQGGKENITNGVCKLITTAITALFGESEADDTKFEKYYITLEGVSLIRLDIMGWKRAVKGTSLTTKVEQVSAFVLTKSTVDIAKTDKNTFLDLYQSAILAENPDATMADVIKEANDLYKALTA
ncbi:hypothetical protein [Vibrio paucivorans]|uniref:Uncharacterized protein n=1 Tax=Vibrio paucivorans TaxID=2829489 RepID=A0A9X3CIS0_9VIBR|nr:hypothetical protein [Vibrio paucivorans]MCW8336608.1 hypothetical protein [Vibrio paucivorans]